MNTDTLVELLKKGSIEIRETEGGFQVVNGSGEILGSGANPDEALQAAAWRYAQPVLERAGRAICEALVRKILGGY